mgnify:CR=1 FL=1|tara:strand:+ start:44 stop:433 length:390 start_codon:yes stop_codon:yes gene_type:complete
MFEYTNINDPFIIHIFTFKGNICKEDVSNYKLAFKELLNGKKSFYIIFDTTEVSNFKMSYLMELFSFIMKFKDEMRKLTKGISVATNNISKSAIDMVLKLSKPSIQTKVFNNLNDCINNTCELNQLNSY